MSEERVIILIEEADMLLFSLVTAVILWQEDFVQTAGGLQQLAHYKVRIENRDGRVILTGNPAREGHSSAWLAIDQLDLTGKELIKIRLRVDRNRLRIRYFPFDPKRRIYLEGRRYMDTSGWVEITIPLSDATPFPSLKFPYLLKPNQRPALYLFFENDRPGPFRIEIDRITIFRREQ